MKALGHFSTSCGEATVVKNIFTVCRDNWVPNGPRLDYSTQNGLPVSMQSCRGTHSTLTTVGISSCNPRAFSQILWKGSVAKCLVLIPLWSWILWGVDNSFLIVPTICFHP
jgi:hypothetical protein